MQLALEQLDAFGIYKRAGGEEAARGEKRGAAMPSEPVNAVVNRIEQKIDQIRTKRGNNGNLAPVNLTVSLILTRFFQVLGNINRKQVFIYTVIQN